MPKAVLINDGRIYTWQGKQVKRDLLERDGSGKLAFVEVGTGVVHKIPAQDELTYEEFPLDEVLGDSDSMDEDTDPIEGFADFLQPPANPESVIKED